MKIREATTEDFHAIWPIFKEVTEAGETYAYPMDCDKEQALQLWMAAPLKTFVVEDDQQILGTYYLKTNQLGNGDHVANCGYMVSSTARGQGLATAMCKHSQQSARSLGYKAMQFNFVVSSNQGAIKLWKSLGFDIVGQIPKAFNHPRLGYIDALVMYKNLA